jgi:hypothetical protein
MIGGYSQQRMIPAPVFKAAEALWCPGVFFSARIPMACWTCRTITFKSHSIK